MLDWGLPDTMCKLIACTAGLEHDRKVLTLGLACVVHSLPSFILLAML